MRPQIAVSGTTSIDPVSRELRHPGSAYHQAVAIFAEIVRVVQELGGTARDIVHVRILVTEGKNADDVGRALREATEDVGPAAVMIFRARFFSFQMLIEIAVDASVLVRRTINQV
ncbi:hypothetical protein BN946_scf184844.g52 [Trametes cinnabarina]|uniref:Uncharacterized protein n=1 Tax=Pycnoporus cinnabarinus TaxID=5643 RepID=A0A060SF59_PYCCI|nr:hypothetical protein BN946_scf184844.g52 [Trametes cinnabarina]